MPEDEEEGFVVRDRRRFMSSDAPAAVDTATPQSQQAATPPPPLPDAPPSVASPLSAPVMAQGEETFMGPSGQQYDPEDMRAAFAEAYEAASPEERAEMEAALSEAQGGAGGAQEIPDIYSILALFLGEVRNIAWLRMGLVANPSTGQIERDFDQARVAIDTVAFLADQLAPVVAPEERLPLQALVSDLQINFVEQTKRAG